MSKVLDVASCVREVKRSYELKSGDRPDVVVAPKNADEDLAALSELSHVISILAQAGDVTFLESVPEDFDRTRYAVGTALGSYLFFVDVAHLMDLEKEATKNLNKTLKTQKQLDKLRVLRSKASYRKAPAEAQRRDASKLEELERTLQQLTEQKQFLEKIARKNKQ
jgi:valyl-tRNA synthetase